MQLLITILFLIGASILSFFRYLIASEPSGLFIRNHPMSAALMIVLFFFALVTLVLCIVKYRKLSLDLEKDFQPFGFGKVGAIAMIIGAILSAVSIIATLSNGQLTIPAFVTTILTVLTVFYFIGMLSFYGSGKIKPSMTGLGLLPVLYAAASLIINYVSTTQMSTPAQYGYIILAQLVNILFFYYCAKILTGCTCYVQSMITSAFCVVINATAYLAPTIYLIYQYFTHQISTDTSLLFGLLKNSFPILLIVFALSFMVFLNKSIKENHVLKQTTNK